MQIKIKDPTLGLSKLTNQVLKEIRYINECPRGEHTRRGFRLSIPYFQYLNIYISIQETHQSASTRLLPTLLGSDSRGQTELTI